MTNFTDPDYLKRCQYQSAGNLSARIQLHERFSTAPVDLHHWFFDELLAQVPAEAKLLEVGCGRGDIWRKNDDRIPAAWSVTLSDLSGGMLADCTAYLGDELASRFVFQPFDVQTIPYGDARFDGVIANMMLYHVPDRVQAVRELRRVLKPNGVLLAMTVGDAHLRELKELAWRFEVGTDDGLNLVDEEVGFTLQNGSDQLTAGFRKVQIKRFEDSLRVTDAQSLKDYLASELPSEAVNSPRGQEIMAELVRRIQAEGGIPIQKEIGIFIASN